MGYDTRYTGEFEIRPPLNFGQIKDSEFLPENTPWGVRKEVKFRLEEDEVETDEGTLRRTRAVAVVPAQSGRYRNYNIVEHLQALVDTFPGHTFVGQFNAQGDDAGDFRRVVIDMDRNAVEQEAILVLPGDEDDAAWLRERIDKVRLIAVDRSGDSSDKIDAIVRLISEPRYGEA